MRIAGKTALVTGAASGLGWGSAQALQARGANVILFDRANICAECLSLLGSSAVAVQGDVASESDVVAAIERAQVMFGGLHCAVNCAGVPSASKIVSKGAPHDYDVWKRVIDVNLTGTFNVMRLAAAAMLDNAPDGADGERGVIINTASGAAYDGQRGQVAYAASKAGVLGLTLPAARDLAEHAVRCVCVAPGLFDTGMVGDLPEKSMAMLRANLLYPRRMGESDEFGALIAHIVENAYFNASNIRFDGGIRLGVG